MQEDNIKVISRCRPLNQREIQTGAHSIIYCNKNLAQVSVKLPDRKEQTSEGQIEGEQTRSFQFDAVYGEDATNQELFNESFRPIVQTVVEGQNGCIFAYGQTGAGKTFTMSGNGTQPGCMPSSFNYIFEYISQQPSTVSFSIKASYIEIYNECITDLISQQTDLRIRQKPEQAIYIENLSEHSCGTKEDLQKILEKGYQNQCIKITQMGQCSARSHTMFIIKLEKTEVVNGEKVCKLSTLKMIDLAGSERPEISRFKEPMMINKSLASLYVVVSKLASQAPHIPYRDSQLTRLMQDALDGNSKTVLMALISPVSQNYEEILSTLRFADQVKKIPNQPLVKVESKQLAANQECPEQK
ncbi:Kinesin-like_protein [Hexamita inflata]|uniref:Kinesin-like protein n=1 Tax=Hexamita inflata TaxID=28002 RepID=A0AA86QJJ9_9EUKA|nr:Kinesin-like protein [Hexamita inflata]